MARILYCNGMKEPVGIEGRTAELSWEIQEEWEAQEAYRITVEKGGEPVYDSGVLKGRQVRHTIPALLEPYRDYGWKLWWRLENGETGEETSHFFTGMGSEDGWEADFITGGTLLRKSVPIDKPVEKAVLFFTGLGYCEAYLNGNKVTDAVLFPSYTVYEKTVEYTAADVTEFMAGGENVIGLMLGGHWPLDETLTAKEVYSDAFYRGRCMGICQLYVRYQDKTADVIGTDRSWRVSLGPVAESGIFDGENYDARKEQPGWNRPGFDDSAWNQAILARGAAGKLSYSKLPPIRVLEELKPVNMWKQGDAWMADFGQNFTGWLKVTVQNPKPGQCITMRHGELLYEDGSLNVENLRNAKATDRYWCKGEATETYEPRFTYHGFRYAEITGLTGEVDAGLVSAKRVHTDNAEQASFQCSMEDMNRIYQCMLWTMRSNMHSVPTDCCQRDERQGWMADAGVSSEFGVINFNLDAFYRKWFRDIRDTQEKDGSMPLAGAPGWPRDTFIWKIGWHMALRNLYLYTGDLEAVRENYPALARYEEHLHSSLANGLLSYDFYNDWLAIEFANNLMVANSFLADFYDAMILFADVLGDQGRKETYQKRKEELTRRINEEYYGRCLDNPLGTGYYGTCDTLAVAPSAMALSFGLVPEELKEKVIREMLFQLTQSRGSVEFPTGILTTGILTQCLSDLGRDDIVWEFLKREAYPSFRFMLSKGATTIWERWQYLVHNEMNSHNHPALCGVGSWFFKALLGLREIKPQQDGGALLKLRPFIPDDLTCASMSMKTPWGEIRLSWKKEADGTRYRAVLPGAVKAWLDLDGYGQEWRGGEHEVLLKE